LFWQGGLALFWSKKHAPNNSPAWRLASSKTLPRVSSHSFPQKRRAKECDSTVISVFENATRHAVEFFPSEKTGAKQFPGMASSVFENPSQGFLELFWSNLESKN
jgi:hypothetical protein